MPEQYAEILCSVERLNKLVLRSQKIDEIQTIKLRNLVSRILDKSFKEKIEPNPWGSLAVLGIIGLKSAIKKSQKTYRSGEFRNSVRNYFTSNETQLVHSKFQLNSALDKIQISKAKNLFQVLKINMGEGPTGAIKFLLWPISEIVVESKAINILEWQFKKSKSRDANQQIRDGVLN